LAPNILGSRLPTLFHHVSFSYTLLCLGVFFVFSVDKLSYSKKYIFALLVIDIVALTMLIHASDGVGSSLGYLLLVSAAMASIFIGGISALGYAALIFFLIMGDTIYIISKEGNMSNKLFATGTLGFLVFVTTFAFNYLTEKIRLSDLLAHEKAQHAAHLLQLAQHIVTRMRTGIIVIDSSSNIELINQSALQMLDLNRNNNYRGLPIDKLSNLGSVIAQWQQNPEIGAPKLHALREGQEVRVSFAALDAADETRTILYLEDYRSIAQHAQQLKLASLGRLTASIAHEVRNPLGAISHATQLLSESDKISPEDERLTQIIVQHSDRVNQIIQNTLNISSRKAPKPQQLELNEWMINFKNDFCPGKDAEIVIISKSDNIQAKFDPVHLNQVLTNLCENGCRYSVKLTKPTSIIKKPPKAKAVFV